MHPCFNLLQCIGAAFIRPDSVTLKNNCKTKSTMQVAQIKDDTCKAARALMNLDRASRINYK